MTTIATDGILICSDGRATSNSDAIQTNDAIKIVQFYGRIYAATGPECLLAPLAEWHNAGADPNSTPVRGEDGGWALLVIDDHYGEARMRLYDSEAPYPVVVGPPYVMGSGGRWAMGAMLAGVDARRAVEIACLKDVYSGGELHVVNIAEALGLQAVKEAAE